MSFPELPITGHCLCGAAPCVIKATPLLTVVCHCDDCRRQSGSAFSVSVSVRRDSLQLVGDTLRTVGTTAADTGAKRGRIFCSMCGSPLVSILAESRQLAFVKAGIRDEVSWLAPQMEVFADCAQAWIRARVLDERRRLPRSASSRRRA